MNDDAKNKADLPFVIASLEPLRLQPGESSFWREAGDEPTAIAQLNPERVVPPRHRMLDLHRRGIVLSETETGQGNGSVPAINQA